MADGKFGIKILCEGLEEFKYIKKLLSFPNIFSDSYYFYEPTNCKGITKIFPRYQDLFTKNLHEVILIFCDADKNSEDFQNLCSNIDDCMFGGNKVSERIIMFANPVSLQIVLSHLGDVQLVSSSKAKNQETVKKLTGIENYQGHDEQIDELLKCIKISNYQTMKQRISLISDSVLEYPSTNFGVFLNYFENSDDGWIRIIKELTKDK